MTLVMNEMSHFLKRWCGFRNSGNQEEIFKQYIFNLEFLFYKVSRLGIFML